MTVMCNYTNLPLSHQISKQILIFLLAVLLGLVEFPGVVLDLSDPPQVVPVVLAQLVPVLLNARSRFSVDLLMVKQRSKLCPNFLQSGHQSLHGFLFQRPVKRSKLFSLLYIQLQVKCFEFQSFIKDLTSYVKSQTLKLRYPP